MGFPGLGSEKGGAAPRFPVLEEFNSLNLCSDKPGPACVRVQGLCNVSQVGL